MKPNGIITLLTDFGESDGFVGAMKGVILSINPDAGIVDLSHQIYSHDIEAGSFILFNSYHFFPPGTIHVAVVDPGVGSERRILAVATDRYFFIAPDNQVLKYIFNSDETLTVVEVLNRQFFLKRISQTFHGRDVFAPVAAHLSLGLPIRKLGNVILDYDRGAVDQPVETKQKIAGKIIHIDKFGNLITNISENQLQKPILSIIVGSYQMSHLSKSYADVEIGKPLAIIGSSGFLEIAVRNDNAQKQLSINRGDMVELIWG
ncbi:MAG TPA: SAM-dependent chlorinase/fluorinase [bacterium]